MCAGACFCVSAFGEYYVCLRRVVVIVVVVVGDDSYIGSPPKSGL